MRQAVFCPETSTRSGAALSLTRANTISLSCARFCFLSPSSFPLLLRFLTLSLLLSRSRVLSFLPSPSPSPSSFSPSLTGTSINMYTTAKNTVAFRAFEHGVRVL